MNKAIQFLKREPVLCIAALCACITMLFVRPSFAYLSYIDFRTLGLLFSLMSVVLGLESCGLFDRMAYGLLTRCKHTRAVMLALVLLPFFASMLITNDVALITFVPFALLVLRLVDRESLLIRTIVLQTIAANIGSMATPVGNPQNLFLFSYYQLPAAGFFGAVLPVAGVSLLGLCATCCCMRNTAIHIQLQDKPALHHPKHLILYLALFLLCLLSVFRVLPVALLVAAVLATLIAIDPKLLRRVDYGLLLTFICFFIFAGNLGKIEPIRNALTAWLAQDALLSSALASQVISNVPAAVLLAGFTANWRGLLLGVNIGGLGTPVASLASLIAMKQYMRAPHARPLRYLGSFLLYNLAALILLLLFSLLA